MAKKSEVLIDEDHAELSPSGASRWMVCPGSVVLEKGEPDSESKYAKEGTLAHALAAHCLTIGVDAKSVLFLKHRGKDEVITQEMADFVQEYVDYIRAKAARNHLMVEQRLDLEWLTGEKNAKGTVDSVILHDDGETIEVDDLKYGMGVQIEAQDNPQLKIYALLALDQFEMMGTFKQIKVGISQPRLDHVDHEVLTVEQLQKFADEVRAAVKRVEAAKKSNTLDGFLAPGTKQCRFCKGRAKCPALGSLIVEATAADFDDVSQTELVEPINLAKAMSKIEMIEIWCKGVRSKVESELLARRAVSGFKLVEGKLSNRAWADEDTVIKRARELGASDEDILNTDVRSPAQMEKKLKKQPKIWTQMQKLLKERKPGPPSVAPVSDPRSEYKPDPAAEYEDVS